MGVVYHGREFRQKYSLSQRQVALGAGLRVATLCDIETGKIAPTNETIARIIAYFRSHDIPCEVGDLLVYEEPVPGQEQREELHQVQTSGQGKGK